jgi:hypothetical protein
LHAMEHFSNATCLLPEQIWDEADIPQAHLHRGGPTGSANPLLWAHSEYLRLLRSLHDGKVFDQIPEVVTRYRDGKPDSNIEFWLPKHPTPRATKGHTLRICAPEPFRLRWTTDQWKTSQDSQSRATGIGGLRRWSGPLAVTTGLHFLLARPGDKRGRMGRPESPGAGKLREEPAKGNLPFVSRASENNNRFLGCGRLCAPAT